MRLLWALLALAILTAPLTGCIAVDRGGDHHWDHPPDDWHDHR